jgi:hypothetical protein
MLKNVLSIKGVLDGYISFILLLNNNNNGLVVASVYRNNKFLRSKYQRVSLKIWT